MLSNEVCTLRTPIESDAAELVACVAHSRLELEPWLPWATADYDEQAARGWITGDIEPDMHRFLIVDGDGEIVGTCGLNEIDKRNNRANLGYWRRSDRPRRGLATSAARLLADHGLYDLGLHRIEIIMAVENEASRRVAERTGATFEGTMRDRLLLHGRYHDAHLFSIVPNATTNR